MQRLPRLKKEMERFSEHPPAGISCWIVDCNMSQIEATIIGSENTPYEKGIFHLEVQIPERYPFEAPKVRFKTPIYHPNIDSSGRICLDILKMPPVGTWKPSLNIASILSSIQLLMNEPNPDDPLMAEISDEYKYSHAMYIKHAKEWTEKYAIPSQSKVSEKENRIEEHLSATESGNGEILSSKKSNLSNGQENCEEI